MGDALERMNAVTIARVYGHCVGGGVVIAAACDLRIAAEGTRFAIPEIDLGIPLAWGGLPDEAKAAGFLNPVVPASELDEAVETLATQLAKKHKLALLATKRHTNAVTEQMVGAARSWSDADGLTAGLRDPEGQAASMRYVEKLRSKQK